MRLGDLDALKEDLKQYFSDGTLDSVSAKLAFNMILRKIDNAPTVKPDISEIEEKFWHRCGFLQGYTTRLNDVRPQGKWVPVSERLPEEFQRILVTIVNYKGDKVVRVAEYYHRGKGVFQIKENREQWEVGEKGLLAWQPLPEPYKEEG